MTDLTDERQNQRVYLIRKQGAWYRPNSAGYTGSAIQAGRYTLSEAEAITHPNGKDGPRDGMYYVHQSDVRCDDLASYRAISAERDRLAAQVAQLQRDLDAANVRAERAEDSLAAHTLNAISSLEKPHD